VIVESTYGGRQHEGDPAGELGDALRRTIGRGGTALLPAFALDRTPMLLREIAELVRVGRAPDVSVYVDSPMALAALEVYRRALYDPAGRLEFRPELLEEPDPFDPGRLQLAGSRAASERLNDPGHPCIILSASGMATGGRVLHHLEHQLPESRNSVILTGYQVPGTRGRALADGAPNVKIHGCYVPVRAEVFNIRGFSAHADAEMLVDWLTAIPGPSSAFVVHGESASAEALAHELRRTLGWNAVVPRYQERVRID
jgi:metallo-beta-lactamase family protein